MAFTPNETSLSMLGYGTVAQELKMRRDSRETYIKIALERHFCLMADARKRLAEMFDTNEIWLILESSMGLDCGCMFDSVDYRYYFILNIEDFIAYNGGDEAWGGDVEELIRKIASLDKVSAVALMDTIDIWHAHRGSHDPSAFFNPPRPAL